MRRAHAEIASVHGPASSGGGKSDAREERVLVAHARRVGPWEERPVHELTAGTRTYPTRPSPRWRTAASRPERPRRDGPARAGRPGRTGSAPPPRRWRGAGSRRSRWPSGSPHAPTSGSRAGRSSGGTRTDQVDSTAKSSNTRNRPQQVVARRRARRRTGIGSVRPRPGLGPRCPRTRCSPSGWARRSRRGRCSRRPRTCHRRSRCS